MPRPNVHLEQAQYNEKLAVEAQSQYPDWAVTKFFYAALHYIEAYALSKGVKISNTYQNEGFSLHEKRQRYVENISDDNDWDDDFAIAYARLSELSQKARYLKNISTTAAQHFKNNSETAICAEELEKIKSKVNNSSLKATARPQKPINKFKKS